MMIRVVSGKSFKEIEYKEGLSVLEVLRNEDIYVPAYCSGRGVCGKCGIQVISGSLEVTEDDRKAFDEVQLNKGYRLSCKAYPASDIDIQLLSQSEDDFEVLSSHGAVGETDERDNTDEAMGTDRACGSTADSEGSYGIAVDIGTTTISMDLIHLDSGKVVESDNRINRQRAFGADVISRIQASNNGQKEALRQSIVKDLVEGFENMIRKTGIDAKWIENIVIGANTTMEHLLLGYSCETLGVYPFEPVSIETSVWPFEKVFDSDMLEASVTILPGISTYVGADIAAGLLCCGFDQMEKPSMLIDLGTNGEMAIGCKDKLLCTSTAAGPAFEGGNISCGIGSVKGAVCAVEIIEKEPLNIKYTTISDGEPVGICGTGVMDITAELVKSGLVDETGLLDDDYFDDGIFIAKSKSGEDIVFTQQDIREIQLAKAAVRAGIEVLVKKYGIGFDDVDTVYLAGGFGFRLNIEKAVSIGLLPEAFAGKIKIAGNTSLKGASACLMEAHKISVMETLIGRCEEIGLGSDKDFNEAYMDAMCFE